MGADGGALVLPSREGPWMLAFGILEEVASVELNWGILGADNIELAQFCTKGVQIASKAWRFDLPEDVSDWELE